MYCLFFRRTSSRVIRTSWGSGVGIERDAENGLKADTIPRQSFRARRFIISRNAVAAKVQQQKRRSPGESKSRILAWRRKICTARRQRARGLVRMETRKSSRVSPSAGEPEPCIVALDVGTSSVRTLLFD